MPGQALGNMQPIHNHGAIRRWGGGVGIMLRPCYSRKKKQYPLYRKPAGPQGPSGRHGKSRPTDIRPPSQKRCRSSIKICKLGSSFHCTNVLQIDIAWDPARNGGVRGGAVGCATSRKVAGSIPDCDWNFSLT